VTAAGCQALELLVEARRRHLSELSDDWPPEDRAAVAELLRSFAGDLVPDAPHPDASG
jgi:hypothetical protein